MTEEEKCKIVEDAVWQLCRVCDNTMKCHEECSWCEEFLLLIGSQGVGKEDV